MATVKIPPVLRAQTDRKAEVGAGGATVGEVLSGLAELTPGRGRSSSRPRGPEPLRQRVSQDEDVHVLDGLQRRRRKPTRS